MKTLQACLIFPGLCLLPVIAIASPLMGKPCRIAGYPYEITCGEFHVPRDGNQPESGKIAISWRKVPAKARYPLADPVIWIPGGPGVNATDRAPALVSTLARLQSMRDIIWMDVRGSGNSFPLDCERSDISGISGQADRFSDPQFLAACRHEIHSRGGVDTFSPEVIAGDYEALRQGLGLAKVNVVAEGAGASIALAWAAGKPAAIRRLVFDSPPLSGTDVAGQLAQRQTVMMKQIDQACRRHPACHAQMPDMLESWRKTLARLPERVTIVHPQKGNKETVLINEAFFAQLLSGILRSPLRATGLPSALAASAQGDWQPLAGLSSMGWPRAGNKYGWGLWLASQCRGNHASPAQQADPLTQWFYRNHLQRDAYLCAGLRKEKPPGQVETAIPALLLTGGMDVLGDNAMPGLRNVIRVEAPGAGAGILGNGCARDVVYRFIRSRNPPQKTSLETGCLENIPPPEPLFVPGSAGEP